YSLIMFFSLYFFFFFFFQAEDGIRDDLVTGVQTCALPISFPPHRSHERPSHRSSHPCLPAKHWEKEPARHFPPASPLFRGAGRRSEERRVGKECRSRGGQYQ